MQNIFKRGWTDDVYISSDDFAGKGTEEAVQLAKSAGLIVAKEPVARIEIPATRDERIPPSLSVVDLPEMGKIKTILLFLASSNERCIFQVDQGLRTGKL